MNSPGNNATDAGAPFDDAAVIDAIVRYNSGRDAELLEKKYVKMADHAFSFLRGSCHLFYQSLPALPLLRQGPLAWSCGDLHFENFGSYKGDDRLVYFDVDDFDEAALAPASWDLLRLLTSIECGAQTLRASPAQARQVRQSCLDAYCAALAKGKPLWVERDTARGLVRHLLADLKNRKRAAFLDKRTRPGNGHRVLRKDGGKDLPLLPGQSEMVGDFMGEFAARQVQPGFFRVLDVARRIAGTGSLGVPRFVILVEGKGSPDGNYLLDLKQARPSALLAPLQQLGIPPSDWPDEATRIATVQDRMQAVDHAFLHAVKVNLGGHGQPFILRELQPSEDRVDFKQWGDDLAQLEQVVATMGQCLAWAQLRAAGRGGAAGADALIELALRSDWQDDLLRAATQMTALTQLQWQAFTRWMQHRRVP